jgi:hypothetical protein
LQIRLKVFQNQTNSTAGMQRSSLQRWRNNYPHSACPTSNAYGRGQIMLSAFGGKADMLHAAEGQTNRLPLVVVAIPAFLPGEEVVNLGASGKTQLGWLKAIS